MAGNRKRRHLIPVEFKTVRDLQEFWDKHSLADHDELLEDVEFDVDLRSRSNFAVEPTLMKELVRRAQRMGVSTETLLNVWISKLLQEPPTWRE